MLYLDDVLLFLGDTTNSTENLITLIHYCSGMEINCNQNKRKNGTETPPI